MSWLYPASKVQRSALALSSMSSLLVGLMVSARLIASISCQVDPSLSASSVLALAQRRHRRPLAASPTAASPELDSTAALFPSGFTEATEKYQGVPLVSSVRVAGRRAENTLRRPLLHAVAVVCGDGVPGHPLGHPVGRRLPDGRVTGGGARRGHARGRVRRAGDGLLHQGASVGGADRRTHHGAWDELTPFR